MPVLKQTADDELLCKN